MIAGFFYSQQAFLSDILAYPLLAAELHGNVVLVAFLRQANASFVIIAREHDLVVWWGIDPDIGGLLLIVRDGHELENLTTGAAGVELLQAVEAAIVAKFINLRIVGRLSARACIDLLDALHTTERTGCPLLVDRCEDAVDKLRRWRVGVGI